MVGRISDTLQFPANLKLFLRAYGEDDSSLAILLDTAPSHLNSPAPPETYFLRYSTSWVTHPSSGSEWTIESAEAVECGLFARDSAFTLSRLTKKIKYYTSSHSEINSSEIGELFSDDKCLNWTMKERTRNSILGIPIINTKKQLSSKIM